MGFRPVLSRVGSSHGYDVVDPTRVNPELGGEPVFRRLVAALRAAGLGIIVDIVPNHMAIGKENPWWLDVLRLGRLNGARQGLGAASQVPLRRGLGARRDQARVQRRGRPGRGAIFRARLSPRPRPSCRSLRFCGLPSWVHHPGRQAGACLSSCETLTYAHRSHRVLERWPIFRGFAASEKPETRDAVPGATAMPVAMDQRPLVRSLSELRAKASAALRCVS
jgi:hypothetical protein